MKIDMVKVHYVLSGESVKATAMVSPNGNLKPVVLNGEDGIDAVCNAVDKITGSQVHRNNRKFGGVKVKVEGSLYEATFGIRVDDRVYTGSAVGIDPYDAIANAYYTAKSDMRTAGG